MGLVEGQSESAGPSTALRAVPLPIAYGDTEDRLARALEEMAEAGFWRIGLTGEAEMLLADALGPKRIALVLGAEGEGMRQNVEAHCDALARLPIGDRIESLNVSNAAAVALYAARSSSR